jgi:hypothetical protein
LSGAKAPPCLKGCLLGTFRNPLSGTFGPMVRHRAFFHVRPRTGSYANRILIEELNSSFV